MAATAGYSGPSAAAGSGVARATVGSIVGAAAVAGAAALFVLARRRAAAAKKTSGKDAVDQLANDEWAWRLEAFPELKSHFGTGLSGELDDMSLEFFAQWKAHCAATLIRCNKIDEASLPSQYAWDLKLMKHYLNQLVEGLEYHTYLMPLNNLENPAVDLPNLVNVTPCNTVEEAQLLVQRLQAFPLQMEQMKALMQQGMRENVVPHVAAVQGVIPAFKTVLAQPVDETSMMLPLLKLLDKLPGSTMEQWVARGREAVSELIFPAFRSMVRFIEVEYLPACRTGETEGCWALPSGKELYASCLRFHTSTSLTPDEIHQMGLAEIARIQGEMAKIVKEAKFDGDVKAFIDFMHHDPQFTVASEQELLELYESRFHRAETALPGLFSVLPTGRCNVIAMPAAQAASAPSAYYLAGTPDGSRPGRFLVNTSDLPSRKTYDIDALTLHESVPGHHLQGALGLENPRLRDVQRFIEDRRYAQAPGRYPQYSAYVEGWGLYSESLGQELDAMYATPYDKMGRLMHEIFRAARLVVDTGIHAKKWTADKAVAYMAQVTGMPESSLRVEVNRYIGWPGQACAYKVGELEIQRLRRRATQALGTRFDLSRFHDLILAMGPVPLDMLAAQVEIFIAQHK